MRIITWVALLLLVFTKNANAQINVTDGQTAAALAAKIAGRGVTILNPQLKCPTWASGTFSVVTSNLGIDSGIVLTNGRAATKPGVLGVNGLSSGLASTNNGTPGDPALTSLAGQNTLDACSLEFDVIPQGDSILFNYVFSSEEYKSAVCGPYNDVFAFFISGPGISGQKNIALVPGTTIPVTTNSINNGTPGSTGDLHNCTIMGPGSPFTSFYKDNSTGQYLTHYGLTTVLQASHPVSRCSVYHLKLAIADAGNGIYDSGVFLEAGSLQSDNYSVAAIRPTPKDTTAFCIKGCLPGKFVISRSKTNSQPQTVKYVIGGDAIRGYDFSTMSDSVIIPPYAPSANVIINGLPTAPSGPKTIKLYILNPGHCASLTNIIDSASMTIYDTLHIDMVHPENILCVGDTVRLKVLGDTFLTYQWSPSDGLDNSAAQQPLATATHDITYNLSATIPGSPCPVKAAAVTIKTRLTPALTVPQNITQCYNTQMLLDASTTDSNLFYSYQWTGPNSFSSASYNAQINHVSQANAGIYTIVVTNDTNGCKDAATIDVQVNTPSAPTVSPIIFCVGDVPKDLPVHGQNLAWYRSENDTERIDTPDYSTDKEASYLYFATQTIGGCESPRTAVGIDVKKCCDGNIFLPNAFTPNGDGLNDKFKPIADFGYFITGVSIVNRWGQLIYSGLDATWDGTYNGIPADVGVYFYRITFGCIRGGTQERQGDVMLVR